MLDAEVTMSTIAQVHKGAMSTVTGLFTGFLVDSVELEAEQLGYLISVVHPCIIGN